MGGKDTQYSVLVSLFCTQEGTHIHTFKCMCTKTTHLHNPHTKLKKNTYLLNIMNEEHSLFINKYTQS